MRNLLDAVRRLKYRAAYLMLRVWWFVRRPATHESSVALWDEGKVLLVRTGYRTCLSLPGSFVRPSESSREAVRRALLKSLGIGLAAEGLRLAWRGTLRLESRRETIDIWEMHLKSPPRIRSHGRDVVWAGWMTSSEALKKRLVPCVALYLTRSRWKDLGLTMDWASEMVFKDT